MLVKVQYVRLLFLIAVILPTIALSEAHCTMRRPAPENVQSLESELTQARENLRISKASEEKIRIDLNRMRASAEASISAIQDYENYHERMKELVRANRHKVDQLEALRRKYAARPVASTDNRRDVDDSGQDPGIPEETISDPVADLDRQLDQSLAAFDAALLKEMELIEIQSKEEIEELTDEMEAARQRLKEQGIDIDAQEGEQSAEAPSDQEPREPSNGTQADSDDPSESQENPTAEGGRTTPTGRSETGSATSEKSNTGQGVEGMSEQERKRYGSGEDDDIVARQLREAAEKETDPELRKKLWKEYETYKKNQ